MNCKVYVNFMMGTLLLGRHTRKKVTLLCVVLPSVGRAIIWDSWLCAGMPYIVKITVYDLSIYGLRTYQ